MNITMYLSVYDRVHSTLMISLGNFSNIDDAQSYVNRQVAIVNSITDLIVREEAMRAIRDVISDYKNISNRELTL